MRRTIDRKGRAIELSRVWYLPEWTKCQRRATATDNYDRMVFGGTLDGAASIKTLTLIQRGGPHRMRRIE